MYKIRAYRVSNIDEYFVGTEKNFKEVEINNIWRSMETVNYDTTPEYLIDGLVRSKLPESHSVNRMVGVAIKNTNLGTVIQFENIRKQIEGVRIDAIAIYEQTDIFYRLIKLILIKNPEPVMYEIGDVYNVRANVEAFNATQDIRLAMFSMVLVAGHQQPFETMQIEIDEYLQDHNYVVDSSPNASFVEEDDQIVWDIIYMAKKIGFRPKYVDSDYVNTSITLEGYTAHVTLEERFGGGSNEYTPNCVVLYTMKDDKPVILACNMGNFGYRHHRSKTIDVQLHIPKLGTFQRSTQTFKFRSVPSKILSIENLKRFSTKARYYVYGFNIGSPSMSSNPMLVETLMEDDIADVADLKDQVFSDTKGANAEIIYKLKSAYNLGRLTKNPKGCKQKEIEWIPRRKYGNKLDIECSISSENLDATFEANLVIVLDRDVESDRYTVAAIRYVDLLVSHTPQTFTIDL